MFKHVIDDKIHMKILDLYHSEELFNLVDSNRRHLREYMPWVDSVRTIKDSQTFIQNCKNKHAANGGFDCGLWYEGEFAGVIGFHSMDSSIRSISIGYWLDKGFEGLGIITKATKLLVDYAFALAKVNRVVIKSSEKNIKSKAIPERLGFQREGIIRDGENLYGEYRNLVVYSKLRRDWLREKAVEKICPLCGSYNNCQAGKGDCWCKEVVVPDHIIEMLSEGERGKACICQSCIEKYSEE